MTTAVKLGPRRLGHVNLYIGDLERTLDFYTNVAGVEMVRLEPGIKAGFVTNGNTHHDLGLVEGGQRGKQPGLNHLGWELDNEVLLVEAYRRAKEAGLKFDHIADHQVSHALYIVDPEGNGHEFYSDAMKDWRAIMRPDQTHNFSSGWDPETSIPDPEPKYTPDPEIRRVEGAVFHPKRVAQVTFAVRDMEKMVNFFIETGGLQEVERSADGSVVLAGAIGERSLTLIQAAEGGPTGMHHYSFEMATEDELDQAEVEMKKKGIQAEKRIDNAKRRSVFVRDPDSLLVEFYADR